MPRTRPPYPLEFRQQIVELVRAGRTPEELAEEFEPSAESIRQWVRQADRENASRRGSPTSDAGPLSSTEREELKRLRQENKQLRTEREVLAKAAAWFARETRTLPSVS